MVCLVYFGLLSCNKINTSFKRERQRQTATDSDRETQTDRDRERDRERHRERQRETERRRQRQRGRDRERSFPFMVYERAVSHSWFTFDPIDCKRQRRLVGGQGQEVTRRCYTYRYRKTTTGGEVTVYLYKPCCPLAPSSLSLLPFTEKQLVPKQYACFKICFWSCLLFVCGGFVCLFLFCVC